MKDIKINLNANEAQGEAYWRKRCDVVEAELIRLRAANAELAEALEKIARGVNCPEGIIKRPDFYASQDYFEHIARAALSRAEQAKPTLDLTKAEWTDEERASIEQKPETCVWVRNPYKHIWVTGCGHQRVYPDNPYGGCACVICGKRVEVKE